MTHYGLNDCTNLSNIIDIMNSLTCIYVCVCICTFIWIYIYLYRFNGSGDCVLYTYTHTCKPRTHTHKREHIIAVYGLTYSNAHTDTCKQTLTHKHKLTHSLSYTRFSLTHSLFRFRALFPVSLCSLFVPLCCSLSLSVLFSCFLAFSLCPSLLLSVSLYLSVSLSCCASFSPPSFYLSVSLSLSAVILVIYFPVSLSFSASRVHALSLSLSNILTDESTSFCQSVSPTPHTSPPLLKNEVLSINIQI